MKPFAVLLFLSLIIYHPIIGQSPKKGALGDIPFTSYKINTNDCKGLLYKSGSRIYIPPKTFVTSDNQPCDGPIEIKYRELHTPIDFILAGISLEYHGHGQLESAGMFEIYASCNGQEMKIAAGKSIQVQFSSYTEKEGFEPFIFDKEKKNWMKIDNEVVVIQTGEEGNQTELWGSSTPPQEEEFDFEEWDFDQEGWGNSDWDYIDTVRAKLFKSMNIDQMGFYNYDYVIKGEVMIPIVASFNIPNPKADEQVYVVYEELNTVYKFWPEDWAEKFTLLDRKDMKIFYLTEDYQVYNFPASEIEKLDIQSLSGKEFEFKLELEATATTVDELASATGLNR